MFSTPTDIKDDLREPLARFLLAMADDKFFLGHHSGDWTGLGPFLEADIAFSNIAQDEIAHAQEIYKLVVRLLGRTEDVVAGANELAYSRPAGSRLCAEFLEPEDDFDWALAVGRQCFFDHFDALRLELLGDSAFKPLADLAGKMIQEVQFHIEHFDGWLVKLGRGTAESRDRLVQAVGRLWLQAPSLFAAVEGQDRLCEAGILPQGGAALLQTWQDNMGRLLQQAGIEPPGGLAEPTALRGGSSSPPLAALLAEISEVYEYEPGAKW